ncbi:MAG: pilus assembly protein N-terminal domain-containing protein [Gemmatimonadaceae bacterium]|nr:pilus assembly protein N-terminal domain-containing protein [Caulobacter sp.]
MRRLPLAFCVCLSLLAGVASAQPLAGQSRTLSIGDGEAVRITLSGPVRDIVVGDPQVADVSLVNDRTLVVMGKKPGATTLLAFDAGGHTLADRQVMVTEASSEAVIVQRGVVASIYACGDRCSKLGGDAAAAAHP